VIRLTRSNLLRKTTISLIICSKNRALSLKRCLESINTREMLEVTGELILVNNGSTDSTEEIMYSFKENSLFPVNIVNEPKPGLGRARNAGLSKVTGHTIIFTDDDCYLAPGYLLKANKVFESGNFHYCGGRALRYDLTDSDYACIEREDLEIIPANSFILPGKIQGSNMVIHRSVIDKIGPFDPMLGAGTPFRCEDIDYCARASMAGFVGAYIPDLIVYHHHGRKPGPDIENLKRDNDYARGAYYTKLILMGKYKYFKSWIRFGLNLRRMPSTIREIKGGIKYIFAREWAE
jgi:glycosyltransferase involved in cell wall biosynthesis